MIRFGGTTEDNKKIIGLALGRKNIEKLTNGEPILVDGESVGAPGVVVLISYAETDDQVMQELISVAGETGTPFKDLNEMLEHAGIDRRVKS